MFFERGVLSGYFKYALQQEEKNVHYFYLKSFAAGLEAAGTGKNQPFRAPAHFYVGPDSICRSRSSKSSCVSCIFKMSSVKTRILRLRP